MDGSKTSWNFFSRLLITVLGLLVIMFVLVVAFGAVHGKQLSPQTFNLRTYEYYRIPWSNIQITPVKYTQISNPLGPFLLDSGYIAMKSGQPRWHEVTYQTSGVTVRRGRAWVLASFLEMENSKQEISWLQWSEQNPELAQVLWRYVAEAAEKRVYFVVPELMAAAKAADRGAELLEQDLMSLLRIAYVQQMTASQLAAEADRAERLEQALEAMDTSPVNGHALPGS